MTSPAIADLQSRWHALNDLDRAKAVLNILQTANISQRKLAPLLNCSASLLGHLLRAAQARPEDRALARRGLISTRELKRRSTATATRRTKMHHEALDFERAKATLRGSKVILGWIADEKILSADGEQIIEAVRWKLAMAEQTGGLPRGTAPVDMTTAQIIRRCRPTDLKADDLSTEWFAQWLALWVYFAMPDTRVRDGALELARADQAKR